MRFLNAGDARCPQLAAEFKFLDSQVPKVHKIMVTEALGSL